MLSFGLIDPSATHLLSILTCLFRPTDSLIFDRAAGAWGAYDQHVADSDAYGVEKVGVVAQA